MLRVERVISYTSVSLILLLGITVLSGYVGILDAAYQYGFGIIIVAYAITRLCMLFFGGRKSRKKP